MTLYNANKLLPIVVRVRTPLQSEAGCISRIHEENLHEGWGEFEIQSFLNKKCNISFVAVMRKKIIGFLIAQYLIFEGEVISLAVDHRFRRLGIATRLVVELHNKLLHRGGHSIFLEVDETNRSAINLYNRLGFQQISLRKSYYKKPDGRSTDALVLRKSLCSHKL
ncbi:MAG TPA: Acetyltransferase YpeA [Hyphomicrobiaceae bacterium MAG_BT-2024]